MGKSVKIFWLACIHLIGIVSYIYKVGNIIILFLCQVPDRASEEDQGEGQGEVPHPRRDCPDHQMEAGGES